MNRVAIIYTTFLRPELMYQTLESIFENWKIYYYLLIGNQTYSEEQHQKIMELLGKYKKINPEYVKHICLPFDCGLSYARNHLVSVAYKKSIPYCFITADSIKFNSKYDLNPYIDFLKSNKYYGLIGFDIENRIEWEGYIKKTNAFEIYPSKDYIDFKYLRLKKVDICRNFFLAKTKMLNKNKWDDNLKLLEHEDWAWRLKTETSYQCFYSSLIKGFYISNTNKEYFNYRHRAYKEYRVILLKKWHLQEPFRFKK